MKSKILHGLSYIALATGSAGALANVAGFLPASAAAYVTLAIAVGAILHKAAIDLGDVVDDGKTNGSFKG